MQKRGATIRLIIWSQPVPRIYFRRGDTRRKCCTHENSVQRGEGEGRRGWRRRTKGVACCGNLCGGTGHAGAHTIYQISGSDALTLQTGPGILLSLFRERTLWAISICAMALATPLNSFRYDWFGQRSAAGSSRVGGLTLCGLHALTQFGSFFRRIWNESLICQIG